MNKISVTTLVILFAFVGKNYAQTIERKRYQILVSPIGFIHENPKYLNNEIPSSPNVHFFYGLSNNLFLGLNYGIGQSAKQKNYSYQVDSFGSNEIFNVSRSRNAETFSLSTQYFFWGDFYGSFNLGFEKGYTTEIKNYTTISGNTIDTEPLNQRTIYSNKYFGNLGIGIKKAIFENFLLGFEFQYGYIESGKQNYHLTYNPEYYRGKIPSQLEARYLNENLFQNRSKNSDFYQINVYTGIAL
ncbi:hypothetical protein [Leptospira bouyouniensis]|uniref:hypothetical protein n=1 Tax=Leptospira bouyouniensis TaxID=2484911 RepID=UPI0010917350|nr:hypothetical protein [Leptospira bouyouniensis]TGM74337.1 hypothetical protein EHQ99_19140 [Leptospira bouyouniensis]